MLEDDQTVRTALRIFATRGVDFADALIGQVNRARGGDVDRKAAKLGFIRVS